MKKFTYDDEIDYSLMANNSARDFEIKIAADLESLSRQIHEAIENGFLDYVDENKDEYPDLERYHAQW